jgi:hypothetical protein
MKDARQDSREPVHADWWPYIRVLCESAYTPACQYPWCRFPCPADELEMTAIEAEAKAGEDA